MNAYQAQFFANCPNNGMRILYTLRIETTEMIPVEQIIARVEGAGETYHEELADELLLSLGGKQTLTADHHGVTITTTRSAPANIYLDRTVGGMAGTPGY